MKETLDIRLPRLMNLSLAEIGRVRPEKLSYELSMSEPSTAKLEMNRSEATVTVGQFMELYETWGSIGIFRVENVETTYKPGLWDRILQAVGLREASVTVTLKHAICTIEDGTVFGYNEYGGTGVTLETVLGQLLALQPAAFWQLGAVGFETEFQYSFENESNLLTALLSTANPLTEAYLWTFDFSTSPWTLNLVSPADDICEMRMNRNADSIKVNVDRSKLVNRIYPLGYGEGVNQLTIADVNGGVKYLEDTASQAAWGIVSLPYPDTTITDAETLKAVGQAQLDARKEPAVTVVATGLDLSGITGESLDRLYPGRICRCPLPDYGVTVNERITSVKKKDVYGNNSHCVVTLANKQADSVSNMAVNARKTAVSELYSQGATNQYAVNFMDNADADNPAELAFYIDRNAVQINAVMCRYELKPFRGYSKGAAAGGGQTRTSGSGGGSSTYYSQETSSYGGDSGSAAPSTGGPSSNITGTNSVSGDPHIHSMNSHTHISVSHTHYMTSHTHFLTFTINHPSHTHSVTVDDHTHDPVLGILLGTTASSVTITVDGNAVPSEAISSGEFNAVPYLDKDENGKITRGVWHEIEITPNQNTRIVANLHVKTFVRSISGGNYQEAVMRLISRIAVDSIPRDLMIAKQMEKNAATLEFDITSWKTDYPDIVCAISMVLPTGGNPFLLSGVSQADNILTWVIGRDATETPKFATIVIRGLSGDVEVRSAKARVYIGEGHPAAGDAPAETKDWLSEAAAAEADRKLAETQRGEAYATAEGQRNSSYAAAEGARDTLYGNAEAARGVLYGQAEAARDDLYEAAEDDRDAAFAAAEIVRTASAADVSNLITPYNLASLSTRLTGYRAKNNSIVADATADTIYVPITPEFMCYIFNNSMGYWYEALSQFLNYVVICDADKVPIQNASIWSTGATSDEYRNIYLTHKPANLPAGAAFYAVTIAAGADISFQKKWYKYPNQNQVSPDYSPVDPSILIDGKNLVQSLDHIIYNTGTGNFQYSETAAYTQIFPLANGDKVYSKVGFTYVRMLDQYGNYLGVTSVISPGAPVTISNADVAYGIAFTTDTEGWWLSKEDLTNKDKRLTKMIDPDQIDIDVPDYSVILSKYNGKIMGVMGDSISDSGTGGDWIKYVVTRLGLAGTSKSVDGGTLLSGVTNASGDPFWYTSRVELLALTCNFVVVLALTNDANNNVTLGDSAITNYDTNTVYGAIYVLYSKLLYKYKRLPDGYYGAGFIYDEHMFADTSERDAYFAAHSSELTAGRRIKVGTGYQEYIVNPAYPAEGEPQYLWSDKTFIDYSGIAQVAEEDVDPDFFVLFLAPPHMLSTTGIAKINEKAEALIQAGKTASFPVADLRTAGASILDAWDYNRATVTVSPSHVFDTTTELYAYFAANPGELVNNLYATVRGFTLKYSTSTTRWTLATMDTVHLNALAHERFSEIIVGKLQSIAPIHDYT